MTFITDPWFYVWAIPAVLITGISKTGLGSGSGGIAVPMMSQIIAPGAAAGIMLPILCVMDVLGQLNFTNLGTALILMPLAPIGVWLGVRLNTVISDVLFRRITLAILFSLGVRLLYEGLK